MYNNYCAELFRRNVIVRDTRNNPNSIHVPLYRTVRSQKSIFYKGPKTWNDLPNDLKSLNNINTFKMKLKRYLLEKQSADIHL